MLEYCSTCFRRMTPYGKLFWVVLFVTVALPLHASNNFLAWITVRSSYTWIHLVLLGLFFVACLRPLGNGRVNVVNFLCLAFVAVQLLAVLTGFKYNGSGLSLDLGRYLLAVLFLALARTKRFGEVDLMFFFYMSLMAMLVNCCISVVMNTTKWSIWGLLYFNYDNRNGGGHINLLSFMIPYALHCVLNDGKKVKWSFFIALLVMGFITMLYAKSRTVIMLAAAGCCAVLALNIINVKGRTYGYRFLASVTVLFFGVFLVGAFLGGSSDLADHILSGTGSVTDNSDTLFTRILTSSYYLERIIENPLGCGFGSTMMLFNDVGVWDYKSIGYNIDNAPVTFGYKTGLVGLIVYLLMTLAPFVLLFKSKAVPKNQKFVISICYALVLIATYLMTAQCIHNYPVVAFLWTFIGLMLAGTPYSLESPGDSDGSPKGELRIRQ